MSFGIDLVRLASIRRSLETLIVLATTVELPGTPLEVKHHLVEISRIRFRLFDKKTPLPKVEAEKKVRVVKVHVPTQGLVQPRVVPRRPSPSATYNAERYLPYRLLWAKVIIRAAYDYALWKDSPELRLRKYAEGARQWLFDKSNLEFGFESICFKFDFPVERIRQQAKLLTKDDVKKLEFRERHGRNTLGEDPFGSAGEIQYGDRR